MRKQDLIAKLHAIPGNPEVMLWNGIVQDFVPIGNIGSHELVKITKEWFVRCIRNEEYLDRLDPYNPKIHSQVMCTSIHSDEELEKLYCKEKYEFNEFVYNDDIKQKRYKKKRILAIDAKVTGRSYYDRLGTVEY